MYKENDMVEEKVMNNVSINDTSADEAVIRKYKRKSQWIEVWQRFKRNKFAMAGLIIFLVMIVLSVTAPLYIDYETDVIKQNIVERLQGPNADNWFGTDELGRDIFSRLIWGSRISLFVGVLSTGLSLTVGLILGSIAGYYGKWAETIIMRFMDILLSLPSILLAIAIVAVFGSSIMNLIFAISVASVANFARVSRAAVITVKDMEYVEAAKSIGAKDYTIILEHVLPNCFAPVLIQAAMDVATAVLVISGLSFIGLGIAPPVPEWGNMLSGGRAYIREYSYIVMFPGIAIMMTVLSLNLLGDGLRDALDPRLK
jgi:peptide/nickel transport system permease protein